MDKHKRFHQEVREKIVGKLKEMGDPEAQLKVLFQEIDIDGQGTLRYCLAVFLSS
jgi:hypothetical protein